MSDYKNSNEQKEYVGVGGHLFAIAAKEFYDADGTGDLFFRSIAGLQDHYQEMLGANVIMCFDGQEMIWTYDAAQEIIDYYFGED